MRDYCAPFRDKHITVIGLGLLGRGVGDAEFLVKCGAHLTVTDMKSAEQLAPSLERLKAYPNITFHLGGHETEDFVNTDLVMKGVKVPLDSPYIAAAREAGVPITMSTALFAKYAGEVGARIVGITGTRGKSTVTHMVYHALRNAAPRQSSGRERPSFAQGYGRAQQVFLGGNIRGISTLAMLPDVAEGDIVVLELDSWQLQGFGELKISPNIAVFTNLYPDHQDYYPDLET